MGDPTHTSQDVVEKGLGRESDEVIVGVKTEGLKIKMKRGELLGFNGCLGYDYDKETKTINVDTVVWITP